MPNRRSEPRVKLERSEGILRGSIPVTILDVSRTGFQLQLRASVRAGTRCELRANLDGIRVSAQVLVTRCTASGTVPDGVGGRAILYKAGAAIVHMDESGGRELGLWLTGLSDVCFSGGGQAVLDVHGSSTETTAPPPSLRIPRLVRDVMSTTVFAVRDDQTLEDLAAVLAGRGIGGAAVVDSEGKLVGVIRAQDIVERRFVEAGLPTAKPRRGGRRGKKARPEPISAPEGDLVRDVMKDAAACTIADDAPLESAVDAMVSRRMNRLVVTRGDRIAGLLDAVDLLELGPRRPTETFGEEIEVLVLD
jgi:CBS domain-containing protein